VKSGLAGFLCFIVLCITLSLGLWPFHAPRNDVTWLNDGSGLAFGKQGTVMSLGVLKVAEIARLSVESSGSLVNHFTTPFSAWQLPSWKASGFPAL